LAQLLDRGVELLDNLEQYELVCIDDLHVIAGKADWEEALFHLFNRLRDSGRRLLIAASTRRVSCRSSWRTSSRA
jgi:DnaA family protein